MKLTFRNIGLVAALLILAAAGLAHAQGYVPIPDWASGPGCPPFGTDKTQCSGYKVRADMNARFSGQTMTSPSGEINSNLNPKFHGASGSSQTMSCVYASGSSMTCGSNPDFTVGESIKIDLAGNAPTSGVTNAPTVTPTCAGSGCSTVGSNSYGYCIMSISDGGNSPLSACSPTTTVSSIGALSVPYVDSGANLRGTDLKNQIAWSAASGAIAYVICRQTNGGPMVPWGITVNSGLSFADWGQNTLGNKLTPANYGLPATCSNSQEQNNNVFAKITGISGSSVSFAANTVQPVNLAGTAYPSTPSGAGTYTVEHDDTPAFRAVTTLIRAASNSAPLVMQIPAGNYNINLSRLDNSIFFTGYLDLSGFKNVEIKGDSQGGTNLIIGGNVVNYAPHSAGVFTAVSDDDEGRHGFGNCGTVTCYGLVDPVLADQPSVTLSTPAQASNFTVGDFVFVMVNQNTEAPQGELNKVVGINAATGVLTLAYPTSKIYSAFPYYGTPPFNAGCFLDYCFNTPEIQDVQPYISMQNVSIHDLHIIGAARVNEINQSYHVHEYNITADNVFTLGQSGLNRDIEYGPGINLIQDSAEDEEFGSVAAASDNTIWTHDDKFTSIEGSASQSCDEASAHIVISDNQFNVSGPLGNTNGSVVGGGGPCFDLHADDNTFNVTNTNLREIIGSNVGIFEGEAHGNSAYIDSTFSVPAFIRTADNPMLLRQRDNQTFGVTVPRGSGNDYIVQSYNAGTLEGLSTLAGGLNVLGGINGDTPLADPGTPTGALCHGSTGNSVGDGPFYIECHTAAGLASNVVGPFTFANGPTALSTSQCVNIATNIPWGYKTCDLLKGDTAHSLYLNVPVSGNTNSSQVTNVALSLRDYGQSTTAGYTPSTANGTDASLLDYFPLSSVTFGARGNGSATAAPRVLLHSDYVGAPFGSLWYVPSAMKTCLESNNVQSENVGTFNTYDFCFNENNDRFEWWYTPNGDTVFGTGSQMVATLNRSGVFGGTAFIPGTTTFAALAGALGQNGESLFCSDCKNVTTDAVVAGAACVGSGHGAIVTRVSSGVFQCN